MMSHDVKPFTNWFSTTLPQHPISMWKQIHGEGPPISWQCLTETWLLPQVQVDCNDTTDKLLGIKMVLCSIPYLTSRQDEACMSTWLIHSSTKRIQNTPPNTA